MAFYEVLIRGNPDGSLSGTHLVEYEADGTDGSGAPRFRIGAPRAVTAQDLTAFVGTQFAAVAAQVDALTAERDALTDERDALKAQIAVAPAQVGNAVTALQGRLAINTVAGLREQVEAAVAAGGRNIQDFWEYATVWHRDNPLLNQLAAAVGMTPQQIDDLFALALTLG